MPRAKLEQGLKPVCGRCKQPLPAVAAAPIIVTDSTFAAEVERSPLPVLVDAWAPWCGPCRMIAPALDEISGAMGDKVKIVKLNVDESPKTASKYGVMSIPTLMIFKGGEMASRQVGAAPKAKLQQWITAAV